MIVPSRHPVLAGVVCSWALPIMAVAAPPELGGYWQVLPTLSQAAGQDAVQQDLQLLNRLDLEWWASDQWRLVGGLRSRLLAGDSVRSAPDLARTLERDPGYVDLSFVPVETGSAVLATRPDRLFAEWTHPDWSVRAGRQRVNWGINLITNPHDLFNSYSFYDFDYPERPGSDALRVQRYLGFASRLEVAASPAGNTNDPTAAALFATNAAGYDWQWLAGTYRDRLALGVGWAGALGNAGFKGELTGFHDADGRSGRSDNLVLATGLDTLLQNAAFVTTEVVWNPGFDQSGGGTPLSGAGGGLAADNPTPAEWQHTSQLQYSLSPLYSVSLAGTWYPGGAGGVLAPAITASLARNWEGRLLGQWIRPPTPDGAEQVVLVASLRRDY